MFLKNDFKSRPKSTKSASKYHSQKPESPSPTFGSRHKWWSSLGIVPCHDGCGVGSDHPGGPPRTGPGWTSQPASPELWQGKVSLRMGGVLTNFLGEGYWAAMAQRSAWLQLQVFKSPQSEWDVALFGACLRKWLLSACLLACSPASFLLSFSFIFACMHSLPSCLLKKAPDLTRVPAKNETGLTPWNLSSDKIQAGKNVKLFGPCKFLGCYNTDLGLFLSHHPSPIRKGCQVSTSSALLSHSSLWFDWEMLRMLVTITPAYTHLPTYLETSTSSIIEDLTSLRHNMWSKQEQYIMLSTCGSLPGKTAAFHGKSHC